MRLQSAAAFRPPRFFARLNDMDIRFIDTHAHLNLAQFAEDRDEVITRNRERGVGCINVGTHKATSQLAVQLAKNNADMWSIIGLHPINTISVDPDDTDSVVESEFDYEFYKQLALQERVVGIGECGFDYWHNSEETYDRQREAFIAQIALANETGLPLMLHLRNGRGPGGRNAYDDALEILKTDARVPGNAHFYAGTYEQAKAFFELGFTISFTGVITFASDYELLVKAAPLDLIHAETDCPFVAPTPYRGQRCEPWMVQAVYAQISALRGDDEEMVRQQLIINAYRLYGLECVVAETASLSDINDRVC